MILRDITDVDCPEPLNCGDIITSARWNNLQDTLNLAHKQGRTVVSQSGKFDTEFLNAFFPLIGARTQDPSTVPQNIELSFPFPMPPNYRRALLIYDIALIFGDGTDDNATGIWEEIQFEIIGTGGSTTIARIFPEGSPFISPDGIILSGGLDHRVTLNNFAEIEIPRSLLPNAGTSNELYLRITRRTRSLEDNPTFFSHAAITWSGVGYVTLKIFKGFDR